MNKKHIISLFAAALALGSVSCDDYLSTVPDNRTELDSEKKITDLLITAYADHLYPLTTETMSDNVDDRGTATGLSSIGRKQEEFYFWQDPTDTGNESTKRVWETYYYAIATANQALEAIEKMGSPESLNGQKGEALITRAYHHFMLVNVFCKQYSEQTSATDLGIPYMEKSETTVAPHYERGTVKEVYEKIQKDIEEGLPLIDDNIYKVPKYHFNKKAAYAFAARFYLYIRDYDKAIEYANEVLTTNPKTMLRDLKTVANLTQEYGPIAEDYIRVEYPANLLLMTGYSQLAYVYGNYGTGKRFMHSAHLASTETSQSDGPWGNYESKLFYLPPLNYNSGYVATPKMPALFEYTDREAGVGYSRTVLPVFQTDEVLLCRAEAYIMKNDFTNATADLALWMSQHTKSSVTLTRELINKYYSELPFYTPEDPTPKKEIHPEFTLSEEQQNFVYCLLHFRRIETIHEGLRWFDVKRFGIKIYRRFLDENYDVIRQDSLEVNDPRRAVQIPNDVISAGLAPNPR